jgi:c(7)-type cytochrome triheme protein
MPRGLWSPMALAVTLASCLLCPAGEPKALTYRGGAQGPVIFDHHLHASKGYTCHDCHTAYQATGKQLFQTRKQGRITYADHSGTTLCFACHNGTIAISDCEQCHRA